MRVLAVLLTLSTMFFALLAMHERGQAQQAIDDLAAQVKANSVLYYDSRANDEAATECAIHTGYKFNCADGSQKASCY